MNAPRDQHPGDSGGTCAGAPLVMRLLSAHVPLSLLLDLALPEPRSAELFRTELASQGWPVRPRLSTAADLPGRAATA